MNQETIDAAIEKAELETGNEYTAIALYISGKEFVGFLLDTNNTGRYFFVGTEKYPSIFQGDE